MSKQDVVVIGAGPAGLTAAYELIGQGYRPIVFEQAGSVGGIARTESHKGYLFDVGGHRFFSKIDKINRLWKEMLGDDFHLVSRLSRIYFNGRFFNYPLHFLNAFSNLGPTEGLRIGLSYLKAQVRPCPTEDTFEQWVSNRFGLRLYLMFFKTYTEKVWGIPCNEIRADWAVQRIKGLSLMTALTNALFGGQQTKSLIEAFEYPARGPGMMWERFREIVEAHGGQVQLNSEVVGLEQKGGRITGVSLIKGGGPGRIAVDHVVSSIPISRLVQALDPGPPENVLKAAGRLSYRSLLIVGLILDKEDVFPDQWIYVHSSDVRVGRIQNFKNWSKAMVPDQNRTGVGMEYFCDENDEIWSMSDAGLVDLASDELSGLGLALVEDVIDGFVIRQPKAYPVYDRDYKQDLQVIRDYLGGIPNLQTIGRNGMHRYNNMDHSMLTGIIAAQNISGADHDLWEVNEDSEYLEEEKRDRDRSHIDETVIQQAFARMDKLAFATALGFVSGIMIFMATMWLVIRGGDVVGANLQLLKHYYPGYTVTGRGACVAFGYTFAWGFLFGWLLAYLRNFFLTLYVYYARKRSELLSLRDFFDHW